MSAKFSFEYVGEGPLGKVYRPIAKVSFYSPNAKNISIDMWLVIDTGADFTILPRHISEKLRISLEKDCTKNVTFGVGGKQAIFFFKSKINVKIGNLKRSIPLAFFDSNDVPPLLGRFGFLETFDTLFSKNRTVEFKD